MSDAFDHATARTRRQRRLKTIDRVNRKGIRIHATVFVAVQALLIVIWALVWQLGGPSYPWFLWALGGWGIGLAIHYAVSRDVSRRGQSLDKG